MMPSSAARVKAGCSARASILPELSVKYRTNESTFTKELHSLAFREIKRPGTKIVAAIVFTVRQQSSPYLSIRHYLWVGCACAPIDQAFRASGQNESLSSQKVQ